MNYELVCGLETHIELSTKNKIFCPCTIKFGSEPNVNCCQICTGMPGTLPIFNRDVIIFAIKMGLALNCKINLFSKMERKSYFYPDLPKAYQISQNDLPICTGGFVRLDSGKKIRIRQMHIEEDAGKIKNDGGICIDYNRSGIPLVEIVSEPDISSVEEVKDYIEKLQIISRYLKISNAKMQEGSIRCDVNLSVKLPDEKKLGTRIEIKNMNSISFIQKAIEYEYKRHVRSIEKNIKLVQETRRFDENLNITESMREKVDVKDYGYFSEPDLPGICIDESEIEKIRKSLPEIHDAKLKRYIDNKVNEKISKLLIKYLNVSNFFDEATKNYDNYERIANFIVGPIFAFLGTESAKEEFKISISPEELSYIASLVDENKLSSVNAKNVISKSLKGENLKKLVKNFITDNDKLDLDKICKEAISTHQEAVNDYLKGKKKALQAIVGKVMSLSKGRADAEETKNIIIKLIS